MPRVIVRRQCQEELVGADLLRALEAIEKDLGFDPNCAGSHRNFWARGILGTVSCFKKDHFSSIASMADEARLTKWQLSRGNLLEKPCKKDLALALSVHCLWENTHLLKYLLIEKFALVGHFKSLPVFFLHVNFTQPKCALSRESSAVKIMGSSKYRGWPCWSPIIICLRAGFPECPQDRFLGLRHWLSAISTLIAAPNAPTEALSYHRC